jgi:hypothetical protein
MGEKRRNPFQGFLDATSDMTRAREEPQVEVGPV